MGCSELLQQGDRKLDDQFLELERKLLEKALKASSDDPSSPRTADQNVTDASNANSTSASSDTRLLSDTPSQDERQAQSKAVVAEWWTMGQNSLMDGALAELQSDFKPMYEGAQTHAVHALSRHARSALEGAAESFVRSKVPSVAIGTPHVATVCGSSSSTGMMCCFGYYWTFSTRCLEF